MISSGLFVLPGLAFAYAGPAVVISYAIAALLMIPVVLSKAELATAMPKSGGSYFYISRSLGPLAGAVGGFANWISIALKACFALVGIGALASFVVPLPESWAVRAAAIGACVLLTVLNLVGTRHAGRFQDGLVIGLIAILLVYSVRGLESVEGARYLPFAPHGWHKVVMVAGMVFVSYGGLTKVVDVSEEIRNPVKNLPWGMALAFIVISALYLLVVYVTVGLTDASELAGSLVPIELGARNSLGRAGVIAVEVAALLAFVTTANAGILSASRSPLAMSRDGLIPEVFGRTSRFATPHVAIALTSLFMISIIAFLSVEDLVKSASSMMLFIFMLDNLSVIVMRRSRLQNYRPAFRAPFCPWMQIAAIVVYCFLIIEMGRVPLVLTAGFALAASAWYFLYVRKRTEYHSALVHLVKSIVSDDIKRSGLEDELRQITLERDEVSKDRFDKLVEGCAVLDIEGEIVAREFFKKVAATLAGRTGLSEDELYERLLKREAEGSTVIRSGLAIPHIVIGDSGLFELVMVRCRPGIRFSELNPLVHTAFVLAGSKDERNYHLQALMHIAHVVQEEGFEERWTNAAGQQGLRDVVLLSSRPRHEAHRGQS
ncbi:MAG TPA: amino acid permease [Candidatus Hydrogenedentes bacterium]|nr:amino acid permease [Candidatus Hydrogenedentota bacterium]